MTTHNSRLHGAALTAFVPSTDLGRSRAFYEDVLGLKVLGEDGYALVVESAGTLVRVTLVGSFDAHRFTHLGWAVDDIAETCRDLVARGVTFSRFDSMEQDADGVWTSPSGAKVAWFEDPDHNLLSVTQV